MDWVARHGLGHCDRDGQRGMCRDNLEAGEREDGHRKRQGQPGEPRGAPDDPQGVTVGPEIWVWPANSPAVPCTRTTWPTATVSTRVT